MSRRSSVTRRWAAALALACGLGTIWALVAGFTGSIISSLRPGSPLTSEDIVVAMDGTPLVQSRIAGNYLNTKLRTLDGKPIELESENWLGGAGSNLYREPGVVEMPMKWNQRVAGCSDFSKPPASWYVLRDDRRPGRAYFTGYDTISRLGLGFLGREGFRASIPPVDEQFDVGHHTLGWGSGAIASFGRVTFGHPASHYSSGSSTQPEQLDRWFVFVMDGNSIREVDLRSHGVREIATLDDLQSISVINQPVPASGVDAEPLEETDAPGEDSVGQADFDPDDLRFVLMQQIMFHATGTLQASTIDAKRKTVHRLLARCTDRIVALNPFDGTQQEFPLPKSLRGERLTAYLVAADRLLLQVQSGWWEQGQVVDLIWLNPAGEVVRQETERLIGYVSRNERKQLWAGAGVVPSLLPWIVGVVGIAPFAQLQDHKAENYLEALNHFLTISWPILAAIVVLSAVLAWIVYRQQKKYCRGNTVLWCVTIFVATVPGFLAYWLMHRGTLSELCPGCGKQAPRKRDACAHCDQPFAEPVLLGTEILA